MRILFGLKVVKKAVKISKNNILYIYLMHIGENHSKKIILIIDDIKDHSIKIYF